MIKAICIDDAEKPENIPNSQWIVKGKTYHVTHVYKQLLQEGRLGFLLKEVNLKGCAPYNCYLASRFSFNIKDLEQLMIMIKACGELNDLDISGIMDQVKTNELVEQ